MSKQKFDGHMLEMFNAPKEFEFAEGLVLKVTPLSLESFAEIRQKFPGIDSDLRFSEEQEQNEERQMELLSFIIWIGIRNHLEIDEADVPKIITLDKIDKWVEIVAWMRGTSDTETGETNQAEQESDDPAKN